MQKWILILATLMLSGCASPSPRFEEASWTNPILAPATAIRVQIDHVSGYAPSTFALEGLRSVMETVGTRATFDVNDRLAAKRSAYTPEEILAIHHATYGGNHSTWRDASGTPVLHILYLDGNASTRNGGLHLLGTPVIVVFPDMLPTRSLYLVSISRAPADLGREGFERTMLVHEYGHALGLVGCGLPEVHRRGQECHTPNPASVMNADYHVSKSPVTWALDDDGSTIWRFDADDWADIRAGQARLAP